MLEAKDKKNPNKAKLYLICAHILIKVTETVNEASLNYYAEDQTKGLIYITSIYSSLTYTSSPYIFEVYIFIFAIYKNSWTIYNFKHKYEMVNLKVFLVSRPLSSINPTTGKEWIHETDVNRTAFTMITHHGQRYKNSKSQTVPNGKQSENNLV